LDSDGNLPSGCTEEDLDEYVLQGMYKDLNGKETADEDTVVDAKKKHPIAKK
jgi:hypothetical protein